MKSIEEIGNIQWGSADGRATLIKDMAIGHLVNCINWIQKNPKNYANHPTIYQELEEFAKHKAFLLFLNKQPYPLKTGERWVVYDPANGKIGIIKPPPEYIDYVKEHYKDEACFKHYFDRDY